MQARFYAAKERSRAPSTPVTSKVKKYKLKSYSSFKFRFRTMNDGQIRRWRAGKRHNAHLKSKKAKRRLRRPEIVHAAYAKVVSMQHIRAKFGIQLLKDPGLRIITLRLSLGFFLFERETIKQQTVILSCIPGN
nr:PREDICTED: uncharacterized protein LOC103984333 isoform X3 [Musa acuminata subsp. malaccensis]